MSNKNIDDNLLIETPFKVLKIGAYQGIESDFFIFILFEKSFYTINGLTGSILHKYEPLRNMKDGNLVDCIYLKESKSFLLAVSNSSLILVPDGVSDISKFDIVQWPKQPINLLYKNNKDIIIICEDGYISQLSLARSTLGGDDVSVFGSLIISNPTELSYKNNQIKHFPSWSNNNTLNIFTDVMTTSNKTSKKSNINLLNEIQMSYYGVKKLLPGNMNWLQKSDFQTVTISTIPEGYNITSVFCCSKSNSIVIVYANNASSNNNNNNNNSAGKIVKLTLEGKLLFERTLLHKPILSLELSDVVWTFFDNKTVTCWDMTYGFEMQKIACTKYSVEVLKESSYLIPFGSKIQLLACNEIDKSTGSMAVYRKTIIASDEDTSSSLCKAIGKLNSCNSTQPLSMSINFNNNNNTNDGNGGKVLSSLPDSMKRKLKTIKGMFDNEMKYEQENMFIELENPTERLEKKSRKFYLDVPIDISEAFLSRLEAANPEDLLASDWDLVHVLIRSGTISLASNPSLLYQASSANRLDVLSQIIRFVADLTEKQCINILKHCLYIPNEKLSNLKIQKGLLVWGSYKESNVTEPEPVHVLPIEKLVPESAKKSRGRPKTKKNEDEVGPTPTPVSLPVSSSVVDRSSNNEESHRLDVIRCIVESVLLRSSAYSSILLSEAVRQSLSPKVTVFFLRIFINTLRGLCSHIDNPNAHIGALTDMNLRAAVTWIEGFIDGNFSAIAMHTFRDSLTRSTLIHAMETVSSADEAMIELESAIGMWSHVNRIIHCGGEHVKPNFGLYRIEHITL